MTLLPNQHLTMAVASPFNKGVAGSGSTESHTSIAVSPKPNVTEGPTVGLRSVSKLPARHKVKEFNSVLTCFLCRGYLINATTVDNCLHSFCRSCIVKHLNKDKHCPQCRPGSKQISPGNIRPDKRLKSLVYKMVPGLYQREQDRQARFVQENTTLKDTDTSGEATSSDEDEDFFSPVEPISLSLEYHPKSLGNCSKEAQPPIRYLQCPAAVTIQHLKRFIASKFEIDLDSDRIEIEIIYENEILPSTFSLMDVGYCYMWKRTAPMRFFYRILVHNTCNTTNRGEVVLCDRVISEKGVKFKTKSDEKTGEGETRKTVRFKDEECAETSSKSGSQKDTECCGGNATRLFAVKTESCCDAGSASLVTVGSIKRESDSRDNKTCYSDSKISSATNSGACVYSFDNNNNSNPGDNDTSSCGNSDGGSVAGRSNQMDGSTDNENDTRTGGLLGNGVTFVTGCNSKSSKSKRALKTKTSRSPEKFGILSAGPHFAAVRKQGSKTSKHHSKEAKMSSKKAAKASRSTSPSLIAGLKNLRSNDSSYPEVRPTPTIAISPFFSGLDVSPTAQRYNLPKTKDIQSPETPKSMQPCDIVVSIPVLGQKLSSSSDDSFENLTLAQLKTATGKSTKQKHSPTGDDKEHDPKPDLPKLKIDVTSLQEKFAVAKKLMEECASSQKNAKSHKRKFSVDAATPDFHNNESKAHSTTPKSAPPSYTTAPQIDLTTYAKNIGLKPINPQQDQTTKPESPTSDKFSAKLSPASSYTSSLSSSSPSSSFPDNFNFALPMHDTPTTSQHKKRKKAKHSKESKDGDGNKKRRIHAEISSQPVDESLKMKVKITANHKTHKSDKRPSPVNDDIIMTSPPTTSIPLPMPCPVTATLTTTLPVKPVYSVSSSASPSHSPSTELKPKVIPTTITTTAQNGRDHSTPLVTSSVTTTTTMTTQVSATSTTNSTPPPPVSTTIPGQVSPIAPMNRVKSDKDVTPKPQPQQDQEKRPLPRMPRIKHTLQIPSCERKSTDESSFLSSLMKLNKLKSSSLLASEIFPVPAAQSDAAQKVAKSNNYAIITNSNNKKILTSVPVTSSPPCINPPTVTFNQMQQVQRLKALQESKISPSPPLPPSLFKTTSMPLHPLLPSPQRSTPTVMLKPKPVQDESARKLKVPPTTRFPASLTIPNPTQTILNTPRLLPMSSSAVASPQQHLKRLAPNDGTTATAGKQQKLDQSYALKRCGNLSYPGEMSVQANIRGLSIEKTKPNQNGCAPSMPTLFTEETNTRRQAQTLVVSPMSSPIQHANQQNSSIVITPQYSGPTKFTDSLSDYHQKKPALEIVRIHSNIPPIDKQKLTVTANNTIKQSPPKSSRPPPPPIPLVKIKRSAPQPIMPKLSTPHDSITSGAGSTGIAETTTSQALPALVSTISERIMPSTAGSWRLTEKVCEKVQSPTISPVAVTSTTSASPPKASPPNAGPTAKPSAKTSPTGDTAGVSPVCDNIGALDLSAKSPQSPSSEKPSSPRTPPELVPTSLPSSATVERLPNKIQTKPETPSLKALPRLHVFPQISPPAAARVSNPVSSRVNGESSVPVVPSPKASPTNSKSSVSAVKPIPSPTSNSEKPADTKTKMAASEQSPSVTSTMKASSPPISAVTSITTTTTARSSPPTLSAVTNKSLVPFPLESALYTIASTAAAMKPIISSPTIPTYASSLNSNNLQNLKLLSESATSREKITIKNLRQVPMLSKLNDKTRPNSAAVRQQNASVRNIPNPSALALRNCPSLPMLASISKTPAVPPSTSSTAPMKDTPKVPELTGIPAATTAATTTTSTSNSAAPNPTPTPAQVFKIDLTVSSPASSPSGSKDEVTTAPATKPSEAVATTSSPSLAPLFSTALSQSKQILKRNLNLERLTATLNQRASAAAISAGDVSATKTATSSVVPEKPPTPPATTVTTSASAEVTTSTVDPVSTTAAPATKAVTPPTVTSPKVATPTVSPTSTSATPTVTERKSPEPKETVKPDAPQQPEKPETKPTTEPSVSPAPPVPQETSNAAPTKGESSVSATAPVTTTSSETTATSAQSVTSAVTSVTSVEVTATTKTTVTETAPVTPLATSTTAEPVAS